MKIDFLQENPLDFYEIILKGGLSQIYTARKKTEINEWMEYSNLLIDKFAIHSSSFFHLSKGIIEHKKSGEQKKMNGYDLFTVNSTFRTLIETYITFNHIFIEPKTIAEKHFRFLIWKLDGLYQETKYKIELSDFDGADKILEEKEETILKTINEIEKSEFIRKIPNGHLTKIFNPTKRKANWRFLIFENRISILQIIGLVEHCCKTRAFINSYKYSSKHIHSNYPAIEEFKKIRGKSISDKYTNPLTQLSIYLTCMLIDDICLIDNNAKSKLNNIDLVLRNFITGISLSIKRK